MARFYFTKQGLNDLNAEYEFLKSIELPRIQEELKDARALGDLRENSALDAAKAQEAEMKIRFAEIENSLLDYELIDEDTKSTTVRIGSEVKVKYIEDGFENDFTIVGTFEADPANGKVSNESPLAKAILGKKEGDEVKLKIRNLTHTIKLIKIL